MLQIHSWPNAILHLDGDAFFASVIQTVNPALKGKPIAVGRERGIATAVSYEAKKYGVKRGMRYFEIKKICPSCLFVESDYEVYNMFSKRMFDIVRTHTPSVEEYSVDEAFADLKGLRRPLNMSYREMGQSIKSKIESSLGITVSVGISLTKSLAKLASSFQKPSGLTVISGRHIEDLLAKTPIINVWGIGFSTASYLNKLGVKTALEFALKPESFIRSRLIKPFYEIWKELRGEKVYELNPHGKSSFKSITRSQTFTPPIQNPDILWSRLNGHIEDAFNKARKLNCAVGKLIIFLKTQEFRFHAAEIKLLDNASFPYLIRKEIKKNFQAIYRKSTPYRTTGCTITDLKDLKTSQLSLFTNNKLEEKVKKIYPLFETKKIDFGAMLFDKEKIEEMKEEKKQSRFTVPVISLCNLS
jgi:DNA polymerase-4/DNA polymerase V